MNRPIFVILIASACAALVAASVTQLTANAADDNFTTESISRTIPYEGYLELDGVPVDGAMELLFSLRDATDAVEWSEEFSASSAAGTATLYNGRFAVNLGATNPISTAILDGEPLFVAVSVADGSGGWTLLDGRQEINMSPYAMWAANATNLTVSGTLNVAGNISDSVDDVKVDDGLIVTGNLYNDSGNLTLTGTVEVTGSIVDQTNGAVTVGDGLEVSNDLRVEGSLRGDSGTNLITVADDVDVNAEVNAERFDLDIKTTSSTTAFGSSIVHYRIRQIDGRNCASASRGEIVMVNRSVPIGAVPTDMDALCWCGRQGSSTYDWHCLYSED